MSVELKHFRKKGPFDNIARRLYNGKVLCLVKKGESKSIGWHFQMPLRLRASCQPGEGEEGDQSDRDHYILQGRRKGIVLNSKDTETYIFGKEDSLATSFFEKL